MVTYTTLSAVLTLGLSLLANRVTAAQYMGGIDMNEACREQHGSWYHAEWERDDCNAWKCYTTNGSGGVQSIDTNRACKVQYATDRAFALCKNGWDDWGCWYDG